MKLKQQLIMLAFALVLPSIFTACDSDSSEEGVPIVAEKGLFVFNSGNQSSSIEGSLSFIDEKTGNTTNNVFKATNGRSLGSTVQDGVILGNNLYIAVSESNTIEVVNKNTLVSVAQIKPTAAQGSKPRDVITDGEYVYASMLSGHVSRIVPSTNTIDKTVKVGPNPEEMVTANGALYVVNSDGFNYPSYANGKSVSKLSLSAFTEEKKIAVGLNPTKIAADVAGNVLVLCMGDYVAIPATIWKIKTTDEAVDMQIPATLMAIKGSLVYTINAPYGVSQVKYNVYNTTSGVVEKENFVVTPVYSPAGIAIDPIRGNLFITSYSPDAVNSYAIPGYVNEYTAEGVFVKKYEVGVGAVSISFLN